MHRREENHNLLSAFQRPLGVLIRLDTPQSYQNALGGEKYRPTQEAWATKGGIEFQE